MKIYRQIYENLNYVENSPTGVKMMRTTSMALIGTRELYLFYSDDKDLNGFYLPPKTEESTFGLSMASIALRKGFQYKQSFDKMFVKIY